MEVSLAADTGEEPAKVALLVMGVGRSGTSALTRVLNLLGAALPHETLGAGSGNERGHWEPLSILHLSDEILSVHGSDWYDTRSFPRAWFASSEATAFIERATMIIEADYEGAPLIVIKEPRICRLAPIYLAALDRTGYATRVVIPLRHPSEVAGSLKRRDSTDELVAELIWIRPMLETEAAIRCCPRVWTTYDQLLEDWWSVQATIASALDVTWPSQPQAVGEDINAFLAPTLRHFDTSKGPGPPELGPITSRIWQTVQAGLIGDEAALREGFDEMRSIIDELDRLGAPQVARERAEKITFDKLREAVGTAVTIERQAREAAETAATIERQAREAAETAATIERQAREAAETAVTIERQAREAAETAVTIERQACEAAETAATIERQAREAAERGAATLEWQARESQEQAAAHARQLEAELTEQRQRITDLYASSSWQLTEPLRTAARMFRPRPRR